MDAATWVAAGAGLTGTVLGGAISTWSALVTQKRTAASLQDEKRRDRARNAAEEILEKIAVFLLEDVQSATMAFFQAHRLVEHISDKEVRIRLRDGVNLFIPPPEDDRRSHAQLNADKAFVGRYLTELLGAYLREEPLPPQPERIEEIRQHYSRATRSSGERG
ncbi:hypothetical protein ACIP5N_32050 [Streptomyces sp. NPDC088768]|uniref:hypothetical protein n=1 Tax=Streptomyces sp. NPDC088768 TaxID=3365894 RepID=UPI003830319A